MPAILVDAGALIALLDASDRHHRAMVAASREITTARLTVWPALTEAMYLLADVAHGQAGLWRIIESSAVAIAPLTSADAPRMRALMEKYGDRPMDLADAALVRVAERERIRQVLTVDVADFSVYRIDGRVRFEILPNRT